MKKFSMAVFSLLMFMAFSGCSTGNRFLNDNEIKDITENPSGIIKLSYKTLDTSDEDENRETIDLQYELYYKEAPNTVTNFISLVKSGFYNGTYLYNYSMAEGSESIDIEGYEYGVDDKDTEIDESSNLAAKELDYTIKGEFSDNGWSKNTLDHIAGTMSMIYDEDKYDTANSRFKICLGTIESRDGAYAAFGKIKDEIPSKLIYDLLKISGSLTAYDFKIESITVDTKDVDFGSPLKIK